MLLTANPVLRESQHDSVTHVAFVMRHLLSRSNWRHFMGLCVQPPRTSKK